MSAILNAPRFWLPLSLLVVGIGIHTFALFGIAIGKTPTWFHGVMLCADLVVFVSLIVRPRIGYWLAVALFLQQSAFQSYWTFQAIGCGSSMWPLQGITSVVCTAALIVLLRSKQMIRISDAPTPSSPLDVSGRIEIDGS